MKKIIMLLVLCLIVSSGFADETKAVTVEKLAQSTKNWNGNLLPAFPEGQPEITILKITIQPGVELPMHEHPVYNAGVLLQGELTVKTKNGKTLHMKAGDPIIEVVNTWHYGINEGAKPAVIMVVYIGKKGQALTVKE